MFVADEEAGDQPGRAFVTFGVEHYQVPKSALSLHSNVS